MNEDIWALANFAVVAVTVAIWALIIYLCAMILAWVLKAVGSALWTSGVWTFKLGGKTADWIHRHMP